MALRHEAPDAGRADEAAGAGDDDHAHRATLLAPGLGVGAEFCPMNRMWEALPAAMALIENLREMERTREAYWRRYP